MFSTEIHEYICGRRQQVYPTCIGYAHLQCVCHLERVTLQLGTYRSRGLSHKNIYLCPYSIRKQAHYGIHLNLQHLKMMPHVTSGSDITFRSDITPMVS